MARLRARAAIAALALLLIASAPGCGDKSGDGPPFEPGDIDGLAEALRRLSHSKEKRVRLGAAGRVAAVERFDRRPLSDQFIEALERA